MNHWDVAHISRILALLVAFAVLVRYFLHWFLQLRRVSKIDEPQELLRFLQQEGRFYNSQLLICVVALILAIWSHNVGRSAPPHVNYAPVANWELRLWDQTGAWDIGLGKVEITLLVCCLWALSHASTVSAQIRLLWAVRQRLGLDMHEYKYKA
jgi:hypothetical protein